MRALLVEDDAMIGKSVHAWLKGQGMAIDWVRDGVAADAALEAGSYDMVLLDLGLPRRSGLDVLKQLRARRNPVPVLILTARDAVADRVAGLDAGADDYLVKPFDLDELSARMRALERRSAGNAAPLLSHGDLELDPASHRVTRSGAPVPLSAREFALLHALMQRPGVPQSRAQLEEKIYGWGEEVESNALEVHVHALRRKLGAEVIRTVRGVGYLMAQDTDSP